MRFARQHPFYGWLFLEPQDYRRIYNQLIEMRDKDLKRGDNSSGFPSGFPEWAKTNLEELAKRDIYKKRIKEHLDQLKLSIAVRERELNQTYLAEELNKMKDKKSFLETLIPDNMISKEVLKVSKEISKFGANHVTVPIFASIVFFTIKDMQMYCLDFELGEINVKESN